MTDFGAGCTCHRGHNGVDYAKGVSLLLIDTWLLGTICFKLTGEASVQSSVGLGVWVIYWVREAIQEVGCRNFPICLRNQPFSSWSRCCFE